MTSESVPCRWTEPSPTQTPVLKLYNSLTKQKNEFVPLNGRRVLWYSCGPTVYDASHMGHARSYISFDIMRRVLSDYFKYDVLYVMNVTDVDDKIINKARKNHLLSAYKAKLHSLPDVIKDVEEALQVLREKVKNELDSDKKAMLERIATRVSAALNESRATTDQEAAKASLIPVAEDTLAVWLDAKHGAEVTDYSIFSVLSRHWEDEFHKDMAALNVLGPDVLTRVSEYIEEIVAYVQKIVANGYAYVSNGSVYFDVAKFSSSPDHTYAKLVPEAIGDAKAMAEGEGELSMGAERQQEKRSKNDFALWKASKPGEPRWPSPWGDGRPGWHIECSVMACDILGERADIHTGGMDLKFPHHDNEIAQAEACFGHNQWISYFLHSGHLSIEGCKMSKSLKNFITIKQVLERYSARQLRLMFLQHSWNSTLDYSEQSMTEAVQLEKVFNEFFLAVKDILRRHPPGVDGYTKWRSEEKELNVRFEKSKASIHEALCDSLDTPLVMKHMRELVGTCNVYIAEAGGKSPNTLPLANIACYLTNLLDIFGVLGSGNGTGSLESRIGFPCSSSQGGQSLECTVMPYVSVLSDFREKVRTIARDQKIHALLNECDVLRDEKLIELGVRMEDKDGLTVLKLVGKEELLKEREQAKQMELERQRLKDEQKLKAEEKKRQKEAQASIPPKEMFRSQTDKYGAFDEQGVPTTDNKGQPLSEKQLKKLRKEWEEQKKRYESRST
ncbi:hypothetical protein EMCRGX_G013781 [Ephydatia muelleri]